MILLGILIAVYIAFYITMPVITLFHELGHALAYLFLTKTKKIDVYIGSYGITSNALNFRIGKLNFHIKKSFPFINGTGLCDGHIMEPNYIKKIVILLAGPFFTVVAVLSISTIIFNTNSHGAIKLYCFACIIFSVISLITNLKTSTVKRNGQSSLYSDGKNIRFVMRLKKLWRVYIEALNDIQKGENSKAIIKLEQILEKYPGEEKILRNLAEMLLIEKRYEGAILQLESLKTTAGLDTEDVLKIACAQSFTKQHENAITNYKEVLKFDEANQVALNNLAYTFIESGEYEEAGLLLNKLMDTSPDLAHGYGTLGYLRVMEEKLDEGKLMLDKCIEVEPENAFTCKALGIYYKKTGDIESSNLYFDKAVKIDNIIDLSLYRSELKTSEIII